MQFLMHLTWVFWKQMPTFIPREKWDIKSPLIICKIMFSVITIKFRKFWYHYFLSYCFKYSFLVLSIRLSILMKLISFYVFRLLIVISSHMVNSSKLQLNCVKNTAQEVIDKKANLWITQVDNASLFDISKGYNLFIFS